MPTVKKQSPNKPRAVKKGGSVLDRIGTLGEGLDEGIKLNIYGRSGTGKTTFTATFPKPMLYAICSGGNRPGEMRSINTPEYRKTIKQVSLEKSTDIGELVGHVVDAGYQTLVLDHASGLQDLLLKEIVGLDSIPTQLGWGVATQQQWGQVALQLKELLRALLNLPINVIIVAQEREFNTDNESALLMPFVGSALTPSVTGWLNPAVDYVCQTFIRRKMENVTTKVGTKTITTLKPGKGVEYCLRTAPDPVFTTKFRVPKGSPLPDVILDPSYEKFVKLING